MNESLENRNTYLQEKIVNMCEKLLPSLDEIVKNLIVDVACNFAIQKTSCSLQVKEYFTQFDKDNSQLKCKLIKKLGKAFIDDFEDKNNCGFLNVVSTVFENYVYEDDDFIDNFLFDLLDNEFKKNELDKKACEVLCYFYVDKHLALHHIINNNRKFESLIRLDNPPNEIFHLLRSFIKLINVISRIFANQNYQKG